jgi:D-threo-aldose 1-dehydrogenase
MSTENKLILPEIIFGTSALGNLYVDLHEDIKTKIVSECFKHAPHPVVFDSAGKYGAGLALEMLGKTLKSLNISSHNVIISNKIGWQRIPLTTAEPTFEPGVWKGLKFDAVQKISYNGIMECFEQGNQLLGSSYAPQLLSVHDPDEYLAGAKSDEEYHKLLNDIIDAYKALSDLKNAGKIKAIGVGAKDWRVIQKIESLIKLDWIMFANSFTILNHPQELMKYMELLRDKGITIVNSAVFQAGFLIGGNYYDYRLITPDTPENLQKFQWRDKFFALCHKYNIKPAIACVNFAKRAPGVSSIALNTSKPEHVKSNVESVFTKVPQEFYKEMKEYGLIEQYCNFI